MDDAEVYERLTKIFHDVFRDKTIQVTPELTAKDVARWDSLNHIRLLLTVSKAFKVKFSATEISDLQNVGDLVALIKRRI